MRKMKSQETNNSLRLTPQNYQIQKTSNSQEKEQEGASWKNIIGDFSITRRHNSKKKKKHQSYSARLVNSMAYTAKRRRPFCVWDPFPPTVLPCITVK